MTGAAAFMDGLVRDAATLVPEDLVLPHLAEALDPEAMVALFRRNMATAGGFGIEAGMVDRIRYRRGARAVVQYTARLVGPSGEQREQWITALLYPRERSRQVWGKLETSMPTIGPPGAVLPPVAFDSDSSLILQVFPLDRRLPSLPTLLNPERLKSVLPRSRAGQMCGLRKLCDTGPASAVRFGGALKPPRTAMTRGT